MTSNLLQKAFSGSIHQYIAAIVTSTFGFLITIYIAQKFAVEEFGIYNEGKRRIIANFNSINLLDSI